MLIQELAERHIVEKMVSKLADSSDIRLGFLKDLAQDIYLCLIEQQDRIENMPTEEQLLYIQRMVFNNLKSRPSLLTNLYSIPSILPSTASCIEFACRCA